MLQVPSTSQWSDTVTVVFNIEQSQIVEKGGDGLKRFPRVSNHKLFRRPSRGDQVTTP
jgi:hypothetical protein